ncbi:hypothetical protein [Yeosuana marina]|uniref:hypothetical protein n=1 Tax=Yeosuana marina TaxID=1565536 RepID=UPI0014211D0E|nr:hypothetical protein [Yeosuana marina]
MKKSIISISLTVLFLGLIVAPTVIAVLDDSIDTSIFYSITEEEENGKAKNLLSPFSSENNDVASDFLLEVHQSFCYKFKNYPKPHLNLISPPPELSIL